MPKTIFSKLIAIFIIILIVAFSITGAMLDYFLSNFVVEEKVEALEKSSQKIDNSFKIYLENYNNPIARFFFESTLELYSSYTNSFVWIVEKNGRIIFSKPEIPEELKREIGDESGYPKLPDERQYKKVMTQDGTVKEIGDFFGFFKNHVFKDAGLGESWLTVGRPLKFSGEGAEPETIGAVYLHTPVPEVQKARNSVFKFFQISVGIAILISLILVYIFSLKITRPLKQINEAAKVIAAGEFRERLNINSKDEMGELAKSFNQMVAALQNIEEMRREFIANVSHELRTPMTSIRGFVEGILDGTIPSEKHSEYLEVVRDETNRLNRLVNDLLDLAKMEAGEITLSFMNFDINERIRRCIIKLESIIMKKGIQVEANFEEEEMHVCADMDAIERVLYNLIHNAIKFTNENGKITITTKAQKDKIAISVANSGAVIEKDKIDVIWERFYKLDKSRGKDRDSTGLGLAIVKNIINEHKQKIWVESEPERGTVFTFTLDRV